MIRKKNESKEMLDYFTKEQLKVIVSRTRTTIAHTLARSGKWHTHDEEILMLLDYKKNSVAHYLAYFNKNWYTNKRKILQLKGYKDNTVAHLLAMKNLNWVTFDPELLLLTNINHYNVGQNLAIRKTICFYNIKILNSICFKNKLTPQNVFDDETFYEVFIRNKKYIATRIKKNVLLIIPII